MFKKKKRKSGIEQELLNIAKQYEENGRTLKLVEKHLERISDSLQRIQESNRNKKYGNVVELKAETSRNLNVSTLCASPKESLCASSAASNALPSETY